MSAESWAAIGSALMILLGIGRYVYQKKEAKKRLAEQAKQDLDNANKNDNPSDFIDGFNRL